ncbi:hypothetical protein C3943_02330 [Lysinibacillus sp. B2A1]|nr:hypothetical protein C3943_02330 [Lysinibacillus sp. B2A1]
MIGSRVIYDEETGRIEHQTGERPDGFPHNKITKLAYIDLPFGFIDQTKFYIESINPETGEPVVKPIPLTPGMAKYKDLEDALLLLTDENLGGIL